MSPVSLNDDVLLLVVACLDPLDALRLSETSRHLHLIALPQALSAVTLTGHVELTAFCRSMLSRPSIHILLVRRLRIALTDNNFSSAPLLADVLQRAGRLRSIIMLQSENFIEAEPRIGDALAALEELEVVYLLGCHERVREMLHRLRSRPRKVILSSSPPYPHLVLYLSRLSALQHTVKLGLSKVTVKDEPPPGELAGQLQAQWDAQYLSLWDAEIPVSFFSSKVPKLRAVVLRQSNITVPASSLPGTATFLPLRTVRHMTLDMSWIDVDTTEADVVRALQPLQCMPPVALSVQAGVNSTHYLWERLAAFGTQIKYLDVDLNCVQREARSLFIYFLCTVPQLLTPLNIVCFRISARSMSDEVIQKVLQLHIPSLRYLAVKSSHWYMNEQTDSGAYTLWSAEGPGDARLFVKMPPETGEAIHERFCSVALEEI
ncbi:hypothetical protein BKA93DRAFT_449016 [Sparassis latifolia]|uniref:F-box domain-containing protein n=1 Tax=Sparassis crispa TaxID=139825 RepID=A0A401H4V3_9APHY|nr:hypothetical protein SCP_1600410 [Sparassis crispa]GBE89380.1 hypothetical protein SCP_1600410 [Sparassis crispa]